eukprot:2914335-Alexandrium_andersonii.AAC.1
MTLVPSHGAARVKEPASRGLPTEAGGTQKGSGTNVWGKALPRGEFALAMISNEDPPSRAAPDGHAV